MTYSYVRHDAAAVAPGRRAGVTWLVHMYDMTHLYVRCDAFVCMNTVICVTRLICMCDMTLLQSHFHMIVQLNAHTHTHAHAHAHAHAHTHTHTHTHTCTRTPKMRPAQSKEAMPKIIVEAGRVKNGRKYDPELRVRELVKCNVNYMIYIWYIWYIWYMYYKWSPYENRVWNPAGGSAPLAWYVATRM